MKLYAIECMRADMTYYIKDADNNIRVWESRELAERGARDLARIAGGSAAYRVVILRVDDSSEVDEFYIFRTV